MTKGRYPKPLRISIPRECFVLHHGAKVQQHIATMSVAVTASLRPLQGLCRQSRSVGALTVRVTSPKANLSIRALVTLPLHRRGYQSQSGSADRESKGTKATKPDMSFRKFIGHALGASLRNLAVSVSPRGVRSAYKDAPVLTSMNIIL